MAEVKVMSADQSTVNLICAAMTLTCILNKNNFCFYIYKDWKIKNKLFLLIENFLMILLPIMVIVMNTFFSFHKIVIRIWMILIVLLDFALQYFGKECGWIEKPEKQKSSIVIWIVLIIAILFTVKS